MSAVKANIVRPVTRTIRYYGCGGTGINLLRSHYENKRLQSDVTAKEEFTFIDTSLANLHNVEISETFTLKGLDGAGGDRRKNVEAILAVLPKILVEHAPADLNIVIFSTAGGTGSTSGPLLIEELLRQGKAVLAIGIGSHTSIKRTTNTIETLTGLEGAVDRTGRPIVMFYHENDLTKSDIDNNLKANFVLNSIGLVASGLNKSLDSSDFNNALDYHRVTHNRPGLAMFDVATKIDDIKSPVISCIALLKDEKQVPPAIDADYDKAGYLPAGHGSENNFYYTVSTEPLSELFEVLKKKKATILMQKKTSQETTRLSDDSSKTHASGLVFD